MVSTPSRAVAVGLLCAALWAQAMLTNDDLLKLTRAGLSDQFITNMVEQQPARLLSDVTRLIELKEGGASEAVILAVARRAPSPEPLTSTGLIRLTRAQFGDATIRGLLDAQPVQLATNATRLIEMRQAGVSEAVIAAAMAKSPSSASATSDDMVQLAQAGFSEGFLSGLLRRDQSERASRETPAPVRRELPAGTEVVLRLIDDIDSEKSKEGDEFRASLDSDIVVTGETLVPCGADARVRLAAKKEAGKLSGRSELTIELVSLSSHGQTLALTSSSVSQAGTSQGSRTLKTAGMTGAVGALIGAIAGGGKGAAIGAGAGAAVGAGAQVFMEGQKVRIPSETVLVFTTKDATAVQVPVSSRPE